MYQLKFLSTDALSSTEFNRPYKMFKMIAGVIVSLAFLVGSSIVIANNHFAVEVVSMTSSSLSN